MNHDEISSDAEDQITRDKRDAARYRWLREAMPDIHEDEAGVEGMAFTYQVPLPVIQAGGPELVDALADAGIAIDGDELNPVSSSESRLSQVRVEDH